MPASVVLTSLTTPGTLATAVLVAVAAGLLTPWARRLAGHDSGWLRRRLAVPLGGLGGAGAAVLAGSWPELVGLALLALGLALLVLVDLAVQRLPDVLVGPLYPVLLGTLGLAAVLQHDGGRWVRAALGAGLLVLGYLVLALIRPGDLGLGDVKLSGLLGAALGWLGWSELVLGSLAAFAVGGLAALVLLAARLVDRSGDLPFGPCMVAGAALGAAFGPTLLPGLT